MTGRTRRSLVQTPQPSEVMGSSETPAGLQELLHGYTVEVLRCRPTDLVEFAVQHFTRVLEKQRNEQGSTKSAKKGVTFDAKEEEDEEGDEEEGDVTVGESFGLKQPIWFFTLARQTS